MWISQELARTKGVYLKNRPSAADAYHKWIEWSEAEQIYLGKCPDVITGIHGDDPVQLYAELCETVEEVLAHLLREKRPLPPPRVRPMQEIG